jgi:hypothetical protein
MPFAQFMANAPRVDLVGFVDLNARGIDGEHRSEGFRTRGVADQVFAELGLRHALVPQQPLQLLEADAGVARLGVDLGHNSELILSKSRLDALSVC